MKKPANPKLICPTCGNAKSHCSYQCATCAGKNVNRVPSVVTRYALGHTFKDIALAFGLSVKTVEYHWAVAKVRYGLQCPQDAVYYALRHGWVNQDGTAVAKGDRVRY